MNYRRKIKQAPTFLSLFDKEIIAPPKKDDIVIEIECETDDLLGEVLGISPESNVREVEVSDLVIEIGEEVETW